MTRLSAAVLLSLVAGCGLFPQQRTKPRRAKSTKPTRVAPAARGPGGASIPERAPSTAEVLAGGLLAGISDASNGLLVDASARPGQVAWLGAELGREDAETARTLVIVRRAAFGVHVPAAGERRPIDDDVLEDRGLGIDTSAIALLGPRGPCPTRRGPPVVTAVDLGGHTLDVRWPLLDCGPGPWAPLGLMAVGIPTTLRWDPPRCDGTDPAEAAWASTGSTGARLGALWDGESLVALIGDGVLWLPGPSGWQTRPFELAGAQALPCPADDDAAAASPDESATQPAASDDDDDG